VVFFFYALMIEHILDSILLLVLEDVY